MGDPQNEEGDVAEAAPLAKSASGNKLHVNSIAAKIDAKTGSDVAVAAAAYLQIVENKDSFSRQDLLNTMKAAKKYYKVSTSNNLRKHLNTLIGSKFNQVAQDQYSLTSAEHKRLEIALA
jgi:hypothetical protein